MRTSSSLTILMTCWAGLSALLTSSPRARSLIAAMNERTTGSATSASSSAIRISRAVASMSASDSRPLPRRLVKTAESRSESVSNNRSPHVGAGQSQGSRERVRTLSSRVRSEDARDPGHPQSRRHAEVVDGRGDLTRVRRGGRRRVLRGQREHRRAAGRHRARRPRRAGRRARRSARRTRCSSRRTRSRSGAAGNSSGSCAGQHMAAVRFAPEVVLLVPLQAVADHPEIAPALDDAQRRRASSGRPSRCRSART